MTQTDRVVIVTGAAGAIGSATAERFAQDGASVIAVDLDLDALKVRIEELDAGSGSMEAEVADVSDEEAVQALFERVLDGSGRVDALINNAGITRDGTIHKMTFDQWRVVMSVNLDSQFLLSREMVRHIRDRGDGGRIVNISSISAKVGNFGQANYAAAKAGTVGLTKVTAREIARYGATANAVAPGFIVSPMTEAIPEGEREERAKASPLGRAGQPSEVADVISWLCSEQASYVTGTLIDVTGGRGM